MMNKDGTLWTPPKDYLLQTNLTAYKEWIYSQLGHRFDSHQALHQWSIDNIPTFWKTLWDFFGIEGDQGTITCDHIDNIEKCRFFPEGHLNFAQNMVKDSDDIAIEFFNQQGVERALSFRDVKKQALSFATHLKSWGVAPGDRVVSLMPNIPETSIAFLGTAAIGAVWSSCSPDFGIDATVDRFGQITPKVLLIADGYHYGEKYFDCLNRIDQLKERIPSIEKVVLVPYSHDHSSHPSNVRWDELIGLETTDFAFEWFPFNHPLAILYSSGTTGKPKCIIHGAGGTLLQHFKEHRFHCDLKPKEKLFYFTTCSWMMWNWLVSGMGSGATIVLFDGNPTFPKTDFLFDKADRSGFHIFGTSAKYIDLLSLQRLTIHKSYELKNLRMIASTGSPLSADLFDYVYTHIKNDVCLASISGGTDIVSCFVLGNPTIPVHRGEIQGPGLGLDIDVFDDEGRSVPPGEKGELVCKKPFPCRPLGFWNDPGDEKYHETYYSRFPNTWHHGDFIERTEHGGLIIHGRSDTVLKPGGVRIGTAEIYQQVQKVGGVVESLAVGFNHDHDQKVILFVKLKPGVELNDQLIQDIKTSVKNGATPRHVPSKVLKISDVPKTRNGKIAEMAVYYLINHLKDPYRDALEKPELLDEIEKLVPLLS